MKEMDVQLRKKHISIMKEEINTNQEKLFNHMCRCQSETFNPMKLQIWIIRKKRFQKTLDESKLKLKIKAEKILNFLYRREYEFLLHRQD